MPLLITGQQASPGDRMPLNAESALDEFFGSHSRSMLAMTSSALSVPPVWNLTLDRSWNVQTPPSASCVQLSATTGTRRLVVEAGDFLYDSDAYNDDLPSWTRVAGPDHLVVPYSLDNNDSRMSRGQGFDLGEQFFAYVRDAFDWLYRRGEEGQARMMSVGLQSRLIGRPGRIGGLARLLDHIQRHEGVWLCTREAIARH